MSEEKKKRGRVRKTPEECEQAFTDLTEAMGLTDLKLSVDPENSKCTVARVEDNRFRTVLGPMASNTFVAVVQGAKTLLASSKVA